MAAELNREVLLQGARRDRRTPGGAGAVEASSGDDNDGADTYSRLLRICLQDKLLPDSSGTAVSLDGARGIADARRAPCAESPAAGRRASTTD